MREHQQESERACEGGKEQEERAWWAALPIWEFGVGDRGIGPAIGLPGSFGRWAGWLRRRGRRVWATIH